MVWLQLSRQIRLREKSLKIFHRTKINIFILLTILSNISILLFTDKFLSILHNFIYI